MISLIKKYIIVVIIIIIIIEQIESLLNKCIKKKVW